MVQIRKMGSFSDIISLIPGMSTNKHLKNLEVDEKEFIKIEAIINSMTPQERRQHVLIKGSRRKRIAKGSGTSVQDINKLLNNYSQVLKMIKKIFSIKSNAGTNSPFLISNDLSNTFFKKFIKTL